MDNKTVKTARTAVMWRLSSMDDAGYRWSDSTYLAEGPTAQDAMRNVVADIKTYNVKYPKWPQPIPQVMWALPFVVPKATGMGQERHDVGEDFENMFDYDGEVEVRL